LKFDLCNHKLKGMELLIIFFFSVFALFVLISYLRLRSSRKKRMLRESLQTHRPHSGVGMSEEGKRLQNGGTIGPGALGGGADFGNG
jgi:hypothetical protein